MPTTLSMSNKSLEEQIEERIRRDQAILQDSDAQPDEDVRVVSDGGERSGCRFPLAVLLALTLTLCMAATALAHFW